MKTEELVYLNFKDWLPHSEKPLLLKTKWGEMTAIWHSGQMGLRRTDCTHPLQNCYISMFDVYEWRYANEQDMNDLLFIKNTFSREMEADEIINSIPNVSVKLSWFKKLVIKIKNLCA